MEEPASYAEKGMDKYFQSTRCLFDHPSGLCTMLSYIPKKLDNITDEIKSWVDGGDNKKLEKWHKEYGNVFANKKL